MMGTDVIAELFKSGVKEFDREGEQNCRDKANPDAKVLGNQERGWNRQRQQRDLLADRALRTECISETAY